MGKYAEALEIWEHEIAKGIIHKIRPEEEDNLELVRLQREAKKTEDTLILLKGIKNLYLKMVKRIYPEMTPQDFKELDMLVGQNIITITNDMLIAFKLIDKDELQKMKEKVMKEEALKK